MLFAAKHVATEAGWRLTTLLRGRRFFTTLELVRLYKVQILSYMESSTPALYHAAPSILARIDRVQERFLREIGVTQKEALNDYRLAPLSSRRGMGLLGALHKINLDICAAEVSSSLSEDGPQRRTVASPEAAILEAAPFKAV